MDRPRQFEKARPGGRTSTFALIFGLHPEPEGEEMVPHQDDAADEPMARERVADWERNNRRMYRRYAREPWLEWLLQDNVVGLWRKAGGRPPLAYPPERCEFSDLFGSETLTINHGVRQEHITTIGAFSRSERKGSSKSIPWS